MPNVLKGLKPEKVWEIFEDICQIPHQSKKEEKIGEYVVNFAKQHNLNVSVDEVGNVIISKPACSGMENRKGIIMQGHLDMVPQKNNDTVHNFDTDPIKPRIDGEWVKATGTTLGADNGIGLAAALAVMIDPSLKHGYLECLLTTDEETGMGGAFGLKPGLFKGDILLNLDSEEEGELCIGCAGGINATAKLKYSEVAVPSNSVAYKVEVKGLKGGHSGVDIKLGRANANKILTRFLWHSAKKWNLKLSSIEGGSLRNAIPREASAVVVVPQENVAKFEECAKKFYEKIKHEFYSVDPELLLNVEKTATPLFLIDEKAQSNLLNALYACPNGYMSMNPDMPEVVQTSNNMAIVKSENGIITVMCLLRSSLEFSKEDLANMIESVFTLAGAEVVFEGSYPGWTPNVHSPILTTMKETYKKMYGKEPIVNVIHAGLECGLLGGVYPNWDMISFGPTICFPHSPDEKVEISSVQKFWDYLIETIKNAPLK